MDLDFASLQKEETLHSLMRWNRPVPRYTSYPTAPQFVSLTELEIQTPFYHFNQTEKPLSLYIHIPFCKTMCLFCACSVILNRNPQRQTAYVDLLCQEIALIASYFSSRKRITQLHFGGGTPTSLSELEIAQILTTIHRYFSFDSDAELVMEIDPRTVHQDGGNKLRFLAKNGFTRVSFGVQDLDPLVQETIRRRQSEEVTVSTFHLARSLFSGINLDLIYGLPFQTRERFQRTAQRIAELKPDRIALFSYAKVPHLKAHQKALPEDAEPSFLEKTQIYLDARITFLTAGYKAIGMDHFALASDELFSGTTVMRNFQGYTSKKAEDLIGLGVTSIGFMESVYLQNVKTLEEYKNCLDAKKLPIYRGYVLKQDDKIRAWVIQNLMCRFEIQKSEFESLFGFSFDCYFKDCLSERLRFAQEGLLIENQNLLYATDLGRILIRPIAALFDSYLSSEPSSYSKL